MNAATEAAERGETAADFLDHAALVSDADAVDEKAAVSLLTVHNAKGLEFTNIFLAGLEEGIFPHSRSLNSEAAMEEERRLCYVGMTRAEKRLYLTWARYRRRFGGASAGNFTAFALSERGPFELAGETVSFERAAHAGSRAVCGAIRRARICEAQSVYGAHLQFS